METLLIALAVFYFIDRWWRDRALKKTVIGLFEILQILSDATDRIERALGTAKQGEIDNAKKYGTVYPEREDKDSPLEILLASQADIYKEVMRLTNPKIWFNGIPFATTQKELNELEEEGIKMSHWNDADPESPNYVEEPKRNAWLKHGKLRLNSSKFHIDCK